MTVAATVSAAFRPPTLNPPHHRPARREPPHPRPRPRLPPRRPALVRRVAVALHWLVHRRQPPNSARRLRRAPRHRPAGRGPPHPRPCPRLPPRRPAFVHRVRRGPTLAYASTATAEFRPPTPKPHHHRPTRREPPRPRPCPGFHPADLRSDAASPWRCTGLCIDGNRRIQPADSAAPPATDRLDAGRLTRDPAPGCRPADLRSDAAFMRDYRSNQFSICRAGSKSAKCFSLRVTNTC